MSESYDNGYAEDFKRNPAAGGAAAGGAADAAGGALSESAGAYLRSLLAEKIKISQGNLPVAARLLDHEVERVQAQGRVRQPDRYVDVYRDKPIKVVAKVLVPIKEHPKFNFVGKLLGPKGSTMQQLQEDTMCKMAILGRGSMRDRNKEEELRNSLDPKYSHLSDDLHVEISALGPPAEAHARIAYALAEVRKHLIPDTTDPSMHPGPMHHMMDRGPGFRPPRASHPPPPPHRPVMPAKTKVLSILDRARSAMAEPYSRYEDPYAHLEPPVRGSRAPPESDYYGYERTERHHYAAPQYDEEPSYYKEEPAYKEYKTSSARDVGSRRAAPASAGGGGASRYHARASPYGRPSK